jgi:RNA polymerase sigma-70 factor (ECF subfamily)
MDDDTLNTVQLCHWVEQWQRGDRAAADDLLRTVSGRLEHLSRRMLRGFVQIRGQVETADVVQGSLVRLLNMLRGQRPSSTAHFFNLAAALIRHELIDLARHFRTRRKVQPPPGQGGSDSQLDPVGAAADPTPGSEELDLWSRFHEAVEQLPAPEREVVSLAYYHGWTQKQMAELFGVDERTIRRRWQSACLALSKLLDGQFPQP